MRISDWSSDVCSSDLATDAVPDSPSPTPLPGRGEGYMTRLASAFRKSPALVTFITAGDGDTAANLDALVAGGADVIELGMPFTDPMADGPAIQAANLPALGKGTTTADIFAIAAAFRTRHPDTPLVLSSYEHPMTIRRPPRFARQERRRVGQEGVWWSIHQGSQELSK